MREIKFRAWLGTHMSKNWEIKSLLRNAYSIGGNTKGKNIIKEEFPLMQYTGLKDKNGKEIYEGDIVSQGDNYPSVIEWNQSGEMIEGTGWCLHEYYPKKGRHSDRYDRYHTTDSYTNGLGEVVGNIYENPELLEGNNK